MLTHLPFIFGDVFILPSLVVVVFFLYFYDCFNIFLDFFHIFYLSYEILVNFYVVL